MTRRSGDNEELVGFLFISPWLIGFLIFTLGPTLYSLYLSFCNYDGLTAPVWVGARNYTELFNDPLFWTSLYNTAWITLLGVPATLLFSLILAFLLNQKRRGIAVYRTLIYMPCLTPVVAMSVLWVWLFNAEYGIINLSIQGIVSSVTGMAPGNVPTPDWFSDPNWSKPTLILMSFWTAGATMLIFLAALQDVPQSLYESAELDGAGWLSKQRHVTIPMISPVIFFNLIIGIINGAQYFTQAYVISVSTGAQALGGPKDSTLFYVMYLFSEAFRNWRMGYASALAWVLFFVTLGLSFLVFRMSAKQVHYQGE